MRALLVTVGKISLGIIPALDACSDTSGPPPHLWDSAPCGGGDGRDGRDGGGGGGVSGGGIELKDRIIRI